MRYLVVIITILALQLSLSADYHEDMLKGHETTMAKLSNVKFRFKKITKSHGLVTHYEGGCWRKGGSIYLSFTKNNGEATQFFMNETEASNISKLRNRKTGKYEMHTSRFETNQFSIDVNPWIESMLLFPEKSNTGSKPLRPFLTEYYDQFIDVGGVPTAISRSGQTRMELDTSHGNLVKSMRLSTKRKTSQLELNTDVLEYSQLAPSFYFPKRIRRSEIYDGVAKLEEELEISEVELNPRSFPTLKFTEKTEMIDFIDGKQFIVDQRGTKSDVKPFAPIKSASQPEGTSRMPTIAEPGNPFWWCIPAGMTLVIAGVTLSWYRRTRLAKQY